MKIYTVQHRTAYTNKMFVIAAENALAAVNIAQIAETERDLHGQFHIPANYEFEANVVPNTYSKDEGIKSKISL